MQATFNYLRNDIQNVRIEDPLNSNNIISDDLSLFEKYEIRDKAYQALKRRYWGQIFENIS